MAVSRRAPRRNRNATPCRAVTGPPCTPLTSGRGSSLRLEYRGTRRRPSLDPTPRARPLKGPVERHRRDA